MYPLRVDDDTNLEEKKVCTTNVNMTPMGRPVNIHPQIRWKQLGLPTNDDDDKESHENYFSAVEEKETNKEQYELNFK